MKGNSLRFRGVELSLCLIFLSIGTILLWSSMVPRIIIQTRETIRTFGGTFNIASKQGGVSSNFSANDTKECDYTKGRWVIEEKYPLYSGNRCKQWLSPMWACRKTRRKQFSYEKLRWQPHNCHVEPFQSLTFLHRMINKTIAYVGDSMGREQFQSLMCMLTGGQHRPDMADVGREFGLEKGKKAVRPDGWAYRFPETNTTVIFHWSACLCDLEPLKISKRRTGFRMHLDRPPKLLQRYLPVINVLVVNTGHHWSFEKLTGNRWVMHVNGSQYQSSPEEAKRFTVRGLVRWLDSRLSNQPDLRVFYRTLSPRHYVNGDWNNGGVCENETPNAVGIIFNKSGSIDGFAVDVVKDTGVKLLDVTALSEVRDEGHVSKYRATGPLRPQHDCVHWCLPGVPDTWNEILIGQLGTK